MVLSPTVFTVDSTADGTAKGTLRWAIAQANANTKSAGSIIEFNSSDFATPQTITLTEGTLDLTQSAGPIEIEGPAAGVTINGNDTADSSVVMVGGGEESVQASLSNLTITGGNANTSGTGFEGGGILNEGNLTLTDCTVEGNYALGGGGIFSSDELTLDECTVTNNTARGDGGGISSGGALTVVDTTISDNSVVNAGGGGISEFAEIKSTPMTLTGCTISGNTAPGIAGIFSYNHATLTNCTISGNTASGSVGGVFVEAACTFDACTISDNVGRIRGKLRAQRR